MKTIYDISLNQMVCMPDGVNLLNKLEKRDSFSELVKEKRLYFVSRD